MFKIKLLKSLTEEKCGIIIFRYNRLNKYSINSLIVSIDRLLGNWDILLIKNFNILWQIFPSILEKYPKIVLALSLMTTQFVEEYDELIELVKRLKKKAILIAGGPHPSGDPYSVLKMGFDYVVIGEGEITFPQLLSNLVSGDPFKVPGIAFSTDEEFYYTGARPKINLNDFPAFPYWRRLFNPIEISRGCNYACFYCQAPFLHGAWMRHRSVENIVLNVEKMVERGLRDIRFITPNALAYGSKQRGEINYSKIEELLSSIKNLGRTRIFYGSFPSEVRPEYVTLEVLDILRKYVDNKRVVIGGQSGSQRILKIIHRGHTKEDVEKAVEYLRDRGFRPEVDFILGLPFETIEDQEETVKFIERLIEMGAIIHIHYYMPLPSTPLAKYKPSIVPKSIERKLSRIAREGKLYGQWTKQKNISWKIVDFIRKGIIIPYSLRLLKRV